MEIWRRRVIVDEDLDFENEEITLTEARKRWWFEIGEDVSEEVKLIDLGKKILGFVKISKIHEHDNTNLYKQFKDLIGEIYTAKYIM
jgi:N utilization substance protein A